MLKLKRIELQGFKSFCDRSEMRFSGAGIAAVVGPNGCGKSNLSDAISWVLGEQSAKSLRGGSMQDVIFAGTKSRKPLGMASVTITMVDPAGGGEARKPGEITITRRLFRSGDSEYLINGKTARLRDIQDLFMGTGLGPESYAIIEQGRIGQILSTKPQDRRAVIEEAAGITRFKTKRRLAEAKLEGAKQNLTRVYDILEEVTRQVTSLKRQAARAKRYGELRHELVGHLRSALASRFTVLERDAAKTALELNEARRLHEELATQLSGAEARQTERQQHSLRLETELREARALLTERRLDAERSRGKLGVQSQQVSGIDQRLRQDETELRQVEARQHGLREELEGHGSGVQELEQQTQAARQLLQDKDRHRSELLQTARERERAIETGRQAVIRLLGEVSTLRNQLAQVDEFLSSVDRDMARSQREEEAAVADQQRLQQQQQETATKLTARQQELQDTTAQRRTLLEETAQRRTQLLDSRKQLDGLRGEVSRVKARRDSLDEILAHHSYTTGAVKRLLTAVEQGKVQGLHVEGLLADVLEVDAAYERAVEEYLHEELEYVLVPDWAQAVQGVEVMRREMDGRATFLVRETQGAPLPDTPGLHQESGVLARLTDVLRVADRLPSHTLTCLPRIAHCFLVQDQASAERLGGRYPHLYFLTPDGLVFHGHAASGGKKSGGGPLSLKRESRELSAKLEGLQNESERTTAHVSELEQILRRLGDDEEQLRSLQQIQEKEALALEMDRRKTTEDLQRVQSRLSVSRLELQRLRQQSERSREQREQNAAQVERKEQERQQQEAVMQTSRTQLEGLQEQLASAAEEHSTLRADLAGLEERSRAGRSTQNRLETQLREAVRRREELVRQQDQLTAERARLIEENVNLQQRLTALGTETEQLDQQVSALAEQETAARQDHTQQDATLKAIRADFQTVQERRSQREVELVRAQSALQYLEETSQKDLGLSLPELASQTGGVVLDEAVLQAAEQQVSELRRKIEQLGPVNPQALEEFEESQHRQDFLTAQRQDLIDSIRDTERAIRDIDGESRRRFVEAFEAINVFFRQMFQTLFGGGVGEMRLTDTENQLESGIDIVAQPPSKKLQNVLLLSGGEKALTAMALLMAVFRYQPSPFCILDEVDAPLDEPNTDRLTRLLRDMSEQTQFIIITHAKRTMEAAQALYGVTMQEPGVSTLVSVRFENTGAPAQMQATV